MGTSGVLLSLWNWRALVERRAELEVTKVSILDMSRASWPLVPIFYLVWLITLPLDTNPVTRPLANTLSALYNLLLVIWLGTFTRVYVGMMRMRRALGRPTITMIASLLWLSTIILAPLLLDRYRTDSDDIGSFRMQSITGTGYWFETVGSELPFQHPLLHRSVSVM
jgi:hypothetical protein